MLSQAVNAPTTHRITGAKAGCKQWYRSVPVLPVFTRKRRLLKCSCTLAITEILRFVTIIKSQGLSSGAKLGQLKDKQDFHSCSSDGHHPVYRRKSLQLAVHTGPTLTRFLLLFPLLCCHSYCDYRYLSCLCSPRNEREGRYHFWQLYFGSPSTHWFGQQYLLCRLLPEASCISYQYKYKPASFLFSSFSCNYKLVGK